MDQEGRAVGLIGDSGTGKTHLLIGLGTAAAQDGFRVRYTLATKLVNELVEAADERQLAKTIARYGRVDLLCIDELGYMQLDRRGAEMLFQVLTEREETASVAIASNEFFSGWTKTFTDPRLCAAIVDRLTFAGNIIETGTESYRLAHARGMGHHLIHQSSPKGIRMHLEFGPAPAPDPDVQFGVAPDQITTELLELCEQFLRQASPIVHTELSQFLAEHGQHGGLGWFLDALGFTTLAHRPAATATDRGLPWR